MQQRLKERLVGASVLVFIAVIFIPMILDGSIDSDAITETNIPERPQELLSATKLAPITDIIKIRTPAAPEQDKNSVAQEAEIMLPVANETAQFDNTVSTKKEQQASEVLTTSKQKSVGLSAWVVQLGSFSTKVNADKLKLKLQKADFPAFVKSLKTGDKIVYRVRVGPELLRSDADRLLKSIKEKMELDGIVLRYP